MTLLPTLLPAIEVPEPFASDVALDISAQALRGACV
jgi:hypothetical protein